MDSLGLLSASDKALLRFKRVNHKTGEEKKYVFQVQYNPSSLLLSTRAGSFQQTNFGKQGMNKFGQYNSPPATSLSVTLIFDDMLVDDSFMLTKVNDLSAGKLVQNMVSKADFSDRKAKYGHTVQPQVEGLLSLLSIPDSNLVEFCWAEMSFKGNLTHLDAKYTMFNPMGHPVRAVIDLTIQQALVSQMDPSSGGVAKESSENEKSIAKYWDDAFTAVFGTGDTMEAVDVDAFDSSMLLQNFINL